MCPEICVTEGLLWCIIHENHFTNEHFMALKLGCANGYEMDYNVHLSKWKTDNIHTWNL